MAATVTSDVSYISKIIWGPNPDQKDIVRNKPLLNATPQRTNFTSAEGIKIPIIYETGQGASATVVTSAANASPDLGKAFLVTQATYYGNVNISGNVLRNALKGGDDSYFLQQFKLAMTNAKETMGVELARQAYGSATGVRAQAATVSGGVITFTNKFDVVFFAVGMKIVASATAGGSLRSGTGTVSAISTAAGTVTYTGTITSIGNTDYLYRQGDAANGSTNLLMSGLADWAPSADPTAGDSFFGVDRSVYPSRLAGVRYDGSGDGVENVLIKAVAQAKAEVGPGFVEGDVYINPLNFAAFQTAKEGGRWITENSSYDVGIDKFQIGAFKLVPDSQCPTGVAYMINDGSFVRYTCGDAPYWQDFDGSDFWLDRSTDTIQAQLVHQGNFAAPLVQRILRIGLPSL